MKKYRIFSLLLTCLILFSGFQCESYGPELYNHSDQDIYVYFSRNDVGYELPSEKPYLYEYPARAEWPVTYVSGSQDIERYRYAVYIFDRDVVRSYPWRTIRRDRLYLQKYWDLPYDALVSFPPAPSMRALPMDPPYGTYNR